MYANKALEIETASVFSICSLVPISQEVVQYSEVISPK